ncbi:MAG: diguanylate cyclase [Clostridiaceae bacterium]|nr:diguanylate cyclase [Clostridiaceae bacterium]
MEKDSDNNYLRDRVRLFFKSIVIRPKHMNDFIAVVPALKITIIYLIISVFWIVVSDNILEMLLPDHSKMLMVSIIKGIVFVTTTSLFIFYRISKELKYAAGLKTGQEELNAELSHTNILFSAVLEGSPDIMVYSLDRNYRYTAFNNRHKYSMLRERGREITLGTDDLELIRDDEKRAQRKAEFDRTLSGVYFSVVEEFAGTEESRSYWQRYYSPILDDDRNVIGLTCFVINITPLKKAQDMNLYISYHDILTDLYNRRYIEEYIKNSDHPENLPISVVIGDVNGLKLVNDAFGHQTGDLLLRKGAEVITKLVEGRGIVSRWGSDEFMILLPGVNEKEAEVLVSRMKLTLSQTQVHSITVDISFGVATKTLAEESILSVIKAAEDHMHKSKIAESKSMRNTIIKTIMNTLHEKNPREEAHSKRVGELCKKIGRQLNLPEVEVNLLNLAGFLHDIGKIAIDDRLLRNDTKFSDEDMDIIRTHPEIGCRILRSSYDVAEIAEAVLYHHERWDGSGYPKGLKGSEIPRYAAVIAVADSFDAMTGKLSYKTPVSGEQAAEEIRSGSGTLYDPVVVDAFLKVVLSYEWDLEPWDI